MKWWCIFLLVFLSENVWAQKNVNFDAIDWYAQTVDATSTESLASLLTSKYETDLEKVRSIYTWITTHIAYNMGVYNRKAKQISFDDEDTSMNWRTADEMMADRVLRRRVAVCDGYSRLFKTLCEYSGIRCELVLGYVRVNAGREKFRTNHTWNAVMIDSSWHLADATWGSGFVTYANEFIQKSDDYYFLTPPHLLVKDHYPENPQWTLLESPPMLHEFKSGPFICKAFLKYGIQSLPDKGIINAMVGDTVRLQIRIDPYKSKTVASSNYSSELLQHSTAFAHVEPAFQKNAFVNYEYVVASEDVSNLLLVYNKDVILQYRLNVIPPPAVAIK